jgi:hypothetical protein
MFLLIVLAVAIVVALIRGGKISRFADLNLRWRGIILIGFLIQVLIFSDFWQTRPDTISLTPYAHIASRTLLLVALAYNYRIPGMPLLTFGLVINSIAIIVNGGYMPVSQEARALAGLTELLPGQIHNNSIGMGPDTQLFFLTDIFAIPKGFPRSNAFSIGDILIAVGAVWLTQKTMVKPSLRAQ